MTPALTLYSIILACIILEVIQLGRLKITCDGEEVDSMGLPVSIVVNTGWRGPSKKNCPQLGFKAKELSRKQLLSE